MSKPYHHQTIITSCPNHHNKIYTTTMHVASLTNSQNTSKQANLINSLPLKMKVSYRAGQCTRQSLVKQLHLLFTATITFMKLCNLCFQPCDFFLFLSLLIHLLRCCNLYIISYFQYFIIVVRIHLSFYYKF